MVIKRRHNFSYWMEKDSETWLVSVWGDGQTGAALLEDTWQGDSVWWATLLVASLLRKRLQKCAKPCDQDCEVPRWVPRQNTGTIDKGLVCIFHSTPTLGRESDHSRSGHGRTAHTRYTRAYDPHVHLLKHRGGYKSNRWQWLSPGAHDCKEKFLFLISTLLNY